MWPVAPCCGVFQVLSHLLFQCRVKKILSSIVITLLERRKPVHLIFFGLCTVCRGLFVLPLGVNGKL